MKKFLNIAGIGVVLLLGVWIYRILFPNDEKLIQQLLAEAAETAAVKPDENPLIKIAGLSLAAALLVSRGVARLRTRNGKGSRGIVSLEARVS